MVKVVTLFIVGILVLGLLGRLKIPSIGLRKGSKREDYICNSCGARKKDETECECQISRKF